MQEWVALGRQDQYNVPLLIDRTYTTCKYTEKLEMSRQAEHRESSSCCERTNTT